MKKTAAKKGSHQSPPERVPTHPQADREKERGRGALDAATAAALLGGDDVAAEAAAPTKLSWNVPQGVRDERDPYGKIESQMLDARTRLHELHPKEPGLYQSELHREYKLTHPEFAAEYEAELRRRNE